MGKDNGCSYGRGTRWGVGIVMGVVVILMLLAFSFAASARGDVAAIREVFSKNEVFIGRLDERLHAIDQRLERIEGKLNER